VGDASQKIDPYLAFLFERTIEAKETRQVFLPVLVEVDERKLAVDPGSWASLDCRYRGRIGPFLSFVATYDACVKLAKREAVVQITTGRRSALATANSLEQTGVRRAHQNEGEHGDCALIVVIDEEVDVAHPAFLTLASDGTPAPPSRVIGVYDLRGDGADPADPIEGRKHTATDIDGYLRNPATPLPPELTVPSVNSSPTPEHGTAVTSIAAGIPVPPFAGGVAPAAKIAFVLPPPDRKGGWPASLPEILTYIDELADETGLPVVVNISQGATVGAHDGTADVERVLDWWTWSGRREGRAVVTCAGNARDWDGHARLQVPPNGPEFLSWEIPNLPPDQVVTALGQLTIELWFDAHDEFSFRLFPPPDPARQNTTGRPASIAPGPKHRVGPGTFAVGGDRYLLAYEQRSQLNQAGNLKIMLREAYAGQNLRRGAWTLEITAVTIGATGHIDAWIEQHSGKDRPRFTSPGVVTTTTLTIPGTTSAVFSVGAVPNGQTPSTSASVFSGRGPTWGLTQRMNKPEISAPGEDITAAATSPALAAKPRSGTSLAAPHLTGAIALMLSKRQKASGAPGWRQLTTEDIRLHLQATGVLPAGPGQWDDEMGYGVLDVEALLRRV
jgi:endonuclease G